MAKLTFGDLLSSSLSYSTTLTIADIVVSLLITFLVAWFIYFIYKKTYSGVLYSKDFNKVLIVVSMVSALIMMGISRNLALSLGMIGALSIVRFRSAIKDPKDIVYLFWSISIGIVNGIQFYKLSITATILIGVILIVLSRKITINQPYVLVLKYHSLDEPKLEKILNKYCGRYKLRNTTLTDEGGEKIIEIKVKKNKENELLKELKSIKEIKKINMFSFEGELSD